MFGELGKRGNGRLKVLHVLGSMGYGGIETWLFHVFRHIDKRRFAIEVCTTGDEVGDYAPAVEEMGGKVIPCPLRASVWTFGRRLGFILRSGSYDVIHSHNYFFSGYILRLAAQAGIPLRIAHIYPTRDLARQTFRRRLYRSVMKRWIDRYGNRFLACSQASMTSFWGSQWENDDRRRVVYCGIDLKPFEEPIDSDSVRQCLGLPTGVPLCINVSRFDPRKNHRGLVEIAAEVLRQCPSCFFVLAGDGVTLPDIQNLVAQRGLSESFRFLPRLPDLVPLWKCADVFVFPSLMEGFGMVLVEAAAAGLPVVASDIPGVREAATACSEVTLVNPQDVNGFADATLRYLRARKRFPPDPDRISPFSVESSVDCLARIYSGAITCVRRTQAV